MPSVRRNAKDRTIGFIACDSNEEVTRAIWQGIAAETRRLGYRLIFYAGGAIHDPIGFRGQGNLLYRMISPQCVDGLIIAASTIGYSASRSEMEKFIESLRQPEAFMPPKDLSGMTEFPTVCLEDEYPGVPSVLKDDYEGLNHLLSHMALVHKRKRIVFMSGPSGSASAQGRLRAYQDSLAQLGLPLDPNLITPSPTSWHYEEALENFRKFIDDHNLQPRFDFDAVVACNDENALAAVTVLQHLGVHIPVDVSVCGFDDLAISGSSTPPLTTIRPPFFEIGQQAVFLLEQQFRGECAPCSVTLPTQLVIRHSCGCLLPTITEAALPFSTEQNQIPENTSLATLLGDRRKEIVERMVESLEILAPYRRGISNISSLKRWCSQLLNSFISDIDHRLNQSSDPGIFLITLESVLNDVITSGGRVKEWQHVISAIQRDILPLVKNEHMRMEMLSSLSQARVMVGETSWRNQSWKRLQTETRAQNMRILGSRLASSLALNELSEVLIEELPRLGIRQGWLALYVDPAHPEKQSKVIMAFNEKGKLDIKDEQAYFITSELFPRGISKKFGPHTNRGASFLVNALFMREEPLGILVIETSGQEGSRENEVLDALQVQISSAIKAALLHQEVEAGWRLAEERRQLAEEANQLKSRFLSMVSHELRTPLNVISGLSDNLLVELKTEEANRKAKSAEEHLEQAGKRNPGHIPPIIGKDIQRIHSSAQHLDNLIRDVLDLAVSQVGQLRLSYEDLDVVDTLKPVIEMGERLAQEKELTWKVEHIGKVGIVSWDRTRLRQVVLNLVTNAIKFTETGGVVLRFEEKILSNEKKVFISVIDTGLGIPIEEKELIFEEFHRSDRVTARGYGGMGLGLAICKKLLELGNGSIGVESAGDYGSGSTFWIALPVKEKTEGLQKHNLPQRVLLLSGDERSSIICKEKLTQDGYDVETMLFQSTRPRLETILIDPPAALIIDFEQSSSLGMEVIDEINMQPELQKIPILFIKLNQKEDSGALYELNTLEKPLTKEKLETVLETHGIDRSLMGRTILLVDDDEDILATHTRLLETHFVGSRVFRARNGIVALDLMGTVKPDLVFLDLMMPEMDGFQVLETMQKEASLRKIPVIILTSQKLTDIEMQHLYQGVAVVLEKGIYTLDETLEQVNLIFSMNKRLGNEAKRIARRAMAYLHEHYLDMITRKELAAHVGVSQEYLSTCFRKETSLTPSSYLERFRILKAKELLSSTEMKVTEVAMEVGFQDSSYFGRIFKRETGVSPYQYRKNINA